MHAFIRDGRVFDSRGRPTIHTIAMDQEPKEVDADSPGVICRAILTLFGKLDGQDRASVLANLQEMGDSDVHRFPGEPPVATAEDRRRRLAHDSALTPAQRAFERRFPGARRISTIL